MADEWISADDLTARLGLNLQSFRNRIWGFPRRKIANHGRGPQYEYHWPSARQIWREHHPTNPLYFYEPSDEALWAWRDIGIAALAEHLNCNRMTLSRRLRARGWIYQRFQVPSLAFAPCVICNDATELARLNALRECRWCVTRLGVDPSR